MTALAGINGETSTTCPYCGVGCGVLATPSADGLSAAIKGDPQHPANLGRLCSKGSALGETLTLDERLLYPEIDGKRASWDKSLDLVASTFASTISEHGPDSVAFYGSGQLLTEDYYVANKLMKGFIGSGNMDTNSRLCMASSVAGHKRAFGSDTVPGCYEDLEEADLVILVGSNFAWCHPVLHQRLLAARETRGTKLVVIDPRETATTAAADLHLAIRPGADVELFNSLFAHLAASSAYDAGYVSEHTQGIGAALLAAGPCDLLRTSQDTGIPIAKLRILIELMIGTPRMMTVYSQGVNQSTSGTDKVNAIINCHLATGRIGKPGMGPFSITGQPNAMGGREVGGLANQLAAHMDFAPHHVDRVRRFWDAPNIAHGPGLKAVDLFDAVAAGQIKALWVMATNPAVSMPNADKVRAAIAACPFVVVSDVIATGDTVRLADVKLPATAWGEKSGTVTNSERRVSQQRSFLKPPGECRHDWDIISDVARRMGFSGFAYSDPSEIFSEHAALSAFENDGQRDFDIGAYADVSTDAYNTLAPFQWPATKSVAQKDPARMFGDGVFFTDDRHARFVTTPFRLPEGVPDESYPLRLNTMRVRDHWHTMTRTGKTARLSEHMAEPFLEIHPTDAERLEILPASLVCVTSPFGRAVLRAAITDRVQPGDVAAPMHWTARHSSNGRIDVVVNPANDPVSGQPELKHTPVSVEVLRCAAFAFVISRNELAADALPGCLYWASARIAGGWRTEIASKDAPSTLLRRISETLAGGEPLQLEDSGTASHRAAVFDSDGIVWSCVAGVGPVGADRSWMSRLLVSDADVSTLRNCVLAGRPPTGEGGGPLVCSCRGVGAAEIIAAARSGACELRAIGKITGAGVTCGSCKPEISRILEDLGKQVQRAAE